jgi:hypothetical protein
MTKAPRRGRAHGTPTKKAIRRAFVGKEDAGLHTANGTMTNAEVRRTPQFKVYVRMIRLAEEIDHELALAMTATPLNPAEIHDCQDRLRVILKDLIPYEKPRLAQIKVSGDRNAPLFDLSGLAEKELLLMRRMMLKAKQVESAEDEEEVGG